MTPQLLNKKLLLYFALLCWFVVPLKAQLTIFGSYEISGDELTYKAKVKGFNSVVAFQYPVNWDSTILEFKSVAFLDIKAFDGINSAQASTNQFRILWEDKSVKGLTFQDTTTLSTLKFKILSTVADTTQINFDLEDNFEVEFVDTTSNSIPIEIHNSFINLRNLTPTSSIDDSILEIKVFPNPFLEKLNIDIQGAMGQVVKVFIFNACGGIIYTEKFVSNFDTMNKNINRSIFQGGGIYFMTIATEKISKTLKLILNDTY